MAELPTRTDKRARTALRGPTQPEPRLHHDGGRAVIRPWNVVVQKKKKYMHECVTSTWLIIKAIARG
jgi:hypothetical protein